MKFVSETSDSSRFYRPNSAAGTSDISTTSVPAQLDDINRVQLHCSLEYQKVNTVYLSAVTEEQPITRIEWV